MRMANSVDADQTAPRAREREKKTDRDLTLSPYNGAALDSPECLRRSGKYLALRMRMANSVDADQTAPRE